MSKAYLIIDMPECCDECAFLDDEYDYCECTITSEMCGYTFEKYKCKMDHCPLREVIEDPDEKDAQIAYLKTNVAKLNHTLEKAYQIIGEIIDK